MFLSPPTRSLGSTSSATQRPPMRRLLLALLMATAVGGCGPTENAPSDPNAAADPVTTAQVPIAPADTAAPSAAPDDAAAPDAEAQNDVVIEQPITILALGDSLTEGLGVDPEDNYPAQLEARLKEMGYRNVTVVNSGLSGETSTGLVNRLDWVAQTKPDITILTIGANDAMRGIDVATIEDNIRTAVTRLQDNGSEVILGGMQIYDNLGNAYVQSFSALYPRVAEDMDIAMIPFFLAGVGGRAELNQADAIHPTKDGYRVIVNDNILPVLQPELEALVAETPQP